MFSHRAFDDLFSEDSDIERLKHLPGVKEQIDSFRQAFKNLSEEFIKNSLEKFEKRKKEVYDFERAVKGVRSHDDYESTQLIDGFNNDYNTRPGNYSQLRGSVCTNYIDYYDGVVFEKFFCPIEGFSADDKLFALSFSVFFTINSSIKNKRVF